jgi:hypothetical protein
MLLLLPRRGVTGKAGRNEFHCWTEEGGENEDQGIPCELLELWQWALGVNKRGWGVNERGLEGQ